MHSFFRLLTLTITVVIQAINATPEEGNSTDKELPLLIKHNSSFAMYVALINDKSYIISRKYPDQKYLQANYFVEYVVRPREELPDPLNGTDRYDGHPVFVVIGEYGVYIKKIERRWLDIPKDEQREGGEMKAILELEPGGGPKIVSSNMNSNETILTIAYSDLTFQILEFQKDPNSTVYGYKLKELHKLDLTYTKPLPIDEDKAQVRSIGAIPYSDHLIISPNRFELLKINRRTGERKSMIALLDSTRHIVCPVATYKHKDNPHSPKRIQRPWISDFNYKIGTEPRCVLTGHDSPTNVVIDWTNMKPISFWDMGLMGGYPHDEDNIVHSMTFFGGIPSASMYVFTTRKAEEFLYMVSTIYTTRHLHRYFDFQKAGSKVVNWVNGTLYIAVYIKDSTVTFPSGSQLAFIKILGSFPIRAYNEPIVNLNGRDIKNYQQAKIFLQMGAEDENENQFGLEDLDEYYLGYYILSNNLEVGATAMPWGPCGGYRANTVDAFKNPLGKFRFNYARHRLCDECPRTLKVVNKFHQAKQVNKTTINCRVEKCKKKGKDPASTILTFSEEARFVKVGLLAQLESNKLRHDPCADRYTLDEDEKGYANDNGCPPSFNRDPNGICRQCHTGDVSYSSSCMIFANPRLVKEDYSFDLQNYTSDKFVQNYPFKGHKSITIEHNEIGKPDSIHNISYQSLYFRARVFNFFVKVGAEFNSLATAWQFQKLPGSELCYKIVLFQKNEEGYKVQPTRDYRLRPMEDYPWFDVSQQKEKYPQGALRRNICIKSCPVGYYYDFESISCRKCGVGCAECHRREFCDVCMPGYSLVKDTKFRSLGLEVKVNTCVVGCQEGFYSKRFSGECLECPKGCELCRDRSSEELAMLTETEKGKLGSLGFCLICTKKTIKNKSMIADISGKCVEKCSGEGVVTINKTSNLFKESPEFEYRVCERCLVSNCTSCPPTDLKRCTACRSGFYLQQEEDESYTCVTFFEHKNFWLFLIIVLMFVVIGLIVTVFCITKMTLSIFSKLEKKKMLGTQKKRKMSVERLAVAGIDNFVVFNDERENPGKDGSPFERMRKSKSFRGIQSQLKLKTPAFTSPQKASHNIDTEHASEPEGGDELTESDLKIMKALEEGEVSVEEYGKLFFNFMKRMRSLEKKVEKSLGEK